MVVLVSLKCVGYFVDKAGGFGVLFLLKRSFVMVTVEDSSGLFMWDGL